MIYFENNPDALEDISDIEGRLRITLRQLIDHRKHLWVQAESAMTSGIEQIQLVQRKLKSPNGMKPINSSGEFQTNPSHRADILLVQLAMADEMIEQIEYVLNPNIKSEQGKKNQDEQQPAIRSVRKAAQPRKQVGRRAAGR